VRTGVFGMHHTVRAALADQRNAERDLLSAS
jgi:hypothetical protein